MLYPPIAERQLEIVEALRSLERSDDLVVVLAVESGSRAWGFASTDSDYDVRFLYVRPPEWYLSIDLEHRPDVIERPIVDDLDMSGWDVRKALRLFRKSNPPLYEWLQCPLIYLERLSFAARLRDLMPGFHSDRASFYHYFRMAEKNVREHLSAELVWRKKYFYVLRPMLALRWVEAGRGPVPIEFQRLLDAAELPGHVRVCVDELLVAKRAGAELDRGPRSPQLHAFIEEEMARFRALAPETAPPEAADDRLSSLFRALLREAWPERTL